MTTRNRGERPTFRVTAGSVSAFFARRPLRQRVHRCAMGAALAGFAVKIAADRSSAVAATPWDVGAARRTRTPPGGTCRRGGQPVYCEKIFENSYGVCAMLVHL